jgi:hypothetical protein
MTQAYSSFREFYAFYLSEHRDRNCRRLHFAGSSLGLVCVAGAIATADAWLIPLGFVVGYALAWVGHLVFEKNRPATFRHPLYSFVGDWVMFRDILAGRIKL